MTLYIVLKYISHFLPVKQRVDLNIRCTKFMKFEDINLKGLTTSSKYAIMEDVS